MEVKISLNHRICLNYPTNEIYTIKSITNDSTKGFYDLVLHLYWLSL